MSHGVAFNDLRPRENRRVKPQKLAQHSLEAELEPAQRMFLDPADATNRISFVQE